MDEMRPERSEKTGDELVMTAVPATPEMQPHSRGGGLHPLLQKGCCPPESLLLQRFSPVANLPGKATLVKEEAGKPSNSAFETMKALTPCLCSCERCFQARSAPRAAISIVVAP